MGIQTVVSRCPVGTASELIIKKGWLQKALLQKNAGFCILQSMGSEHLRAHFTQEAPLHFRDGGNIPPIWAQSQGERSVLLGVTFQKDKRGIFVRPDSPIKDIKDLKGKRLAIPVREDAIVDFRQLTALHGFQNILAHVGILMDEVELCPIKCKNIVPSLKKNLDLLDNSVDFITEEIQAVIDGKADAAFTSSVKTERHENAKILANILPLELHREIPDINNDSVLAITCTKPFAYEHPDLVVVYLKELIKAGRWIPDHKKEFVETIASGIYGATPEEIMATFDEELLFQRIPELSDRGFEMLNKEKEFLIQQNMIPKEKDFDIEAWADPGFLEQAFKELENDCN